MKKSPIFVAACATVLALVMASCAPTTTTAPTTAPSTTGALPSTTAAPLATTSPGAEVPKYGGQLTFMLPADIMGFDPAITLQMECKASYMVNEELIGEDWTKGPAGTHETDWDIGFVGLIGLDTGCLAESWQLPDNQTIIFNIRKGVHWHNKPPVNGREFTAADVVWNINRNFTNSKSYLYGAYPQELRPISWKALDKYTVEVKVPQLTHGLMVLVLGDFMWQIPSEVVERYGDMSDWRNVCGTGPFMLTDYISGSSATYKRNPGYWKKDPLHPQNQLPYLETLKTLIIVDPSTQLAALRTGKLDVMAGVSWEDADSLIKANSRVKYAKSPGGVKVLVGRMDKTELPFKDIRVRRALNMAVNKQDILDSYYDGNGILFGYPYWPTEVFKPFYTPLEQQPQEVQDIFKYDVTKAKALLAEAGYPNGFKTEVACQTGDQADYLSMIREYLLPVGVDMEIKPLEVGVYRSVYRGRTHKEMLFRDQPVNMPFRMLATRIESFDNGAYFEHERTRACYNAINQVIGKNDAEVARLLKEIGPFELSQAWAVWLPVPYVYRMWWPWVQNYHGESTLGYDNQNEYTHYVWVDMALKSSMGY